MPLTRLQRYLSPIEPSEPPAKQVEGIQRALFGPGVDSHTRCEAMVRLLVGRAPEVFWPALKDVWPMCDDTWKWKNFLLDLMLSQKIRPNLDLVLSQKIPPNLEPMKWPVRIYRGCTRARVRGLSWTIDRAVAEKFARGHRGIPVAEPPVIAEAVVEREAVFVALHERNEGEVLIDPRRLRKLVVRDAKAVAESARTALL
jgi:hypothetical protein